MYSYDLEKALKQIKEKNFKKILIQLPEGLRRDALKILSFFQSKGIFCSYYLESSFGACDLVDYKIKNFGFDCILHFGHTKMIEPLLPTIFVPVIKKADPEKIAKLINSFLEEKNPKQISLVASAQYLYLIPKLIDNLKTKVKNRKPERTEENQVLGCDFSTLSPDSDLNIVLSDSFFHAQGALLFSKKPTYLLDVVEEKLIDISKEQDKFLRQRISVLSKAKHSQIFGIIVSTKPGQAYFNLALKAKEILEAKGKTAYIFIGDRINPSDFLGIKIDCLVNTACPRIATDDLSLYNIPIINYSELNFLENPEKILE